MLQVSKPRLRKIKFKKLVQLGCESRSNAIVHIRCPRAIRPVRGPG